MADFKEIQVDGQVYQVKDETARNSQGGYEPPTGGIPKTDLASDVQTSLGKADTALQQADKTQLQNAINSLQSALDTLIGSGNVQGAIDTFNEVKTFLNGIDTDDPTLANQLLALNNSITALQNTLSQKANSSDVANTYATKNELNTGLAGKQDTLTFDDAPTAGSNNPVKSGGIKTAIDNVTPTIDANGKWVIGGVTTDKDAQGPRGNTTLVNENAQGIQALIVNNVVDGGETDILSAEMGKVIRQNIMKIFNALGTYAFPEGKPVLNWGSTVINHSINVNGVTGGLTISDVEVDGTSVGSLPAQVVEGKSLSLRLALPSNLYVFDDNVSVKMGGVDITSTAFDETTGEINIAAVTDDVVIVATALTYVGYGESNSPLVLHLDGKNMGSTANQWRNLCNENKPLVLSGGYTKNSDGVTFDGSSGTGKIESLGIDLPWQSSAMEAVYKQSNTTPPQVIALCGNTYNTVLCVATDGTTYIMSNCGTIPDGASALQGSNVNLLSRNYTMPYNANTVVHLVNNGGNDHYLNNVALDKETQITGILPANFVGISTSAHNNAGEFWVSGYIARSNSYFGPLKGTLYAVRAYSRVLTASELAQNHKVDKKRFNIA